MGCYTCRQKRTEEKAVVHTVTREDRLNKGSLSTLLFLTLRSPSAVSHAYHPSSGHSINQLTILIKASGSTALFILLSSSE